MFSSTWRVLSIWGGWKIESHTANCWSYTLFQWNLHNLVCSMLGRCSRESRTSRTTTRTITEAKARTTTNTTNTNNVERHIRWIKMIQSQVWLILQNCSLCTFNTIMFIDLGVWSFSWCYWSLNMPRVPRGTAKGQERCFVLRCQGSCARMKRPSFVLIPWVGNFIPQKVPAAALSIDVICSNTHVK